MTAEQRTHLKLALDQRRRQLVADDENGCSGCGTEMENHTSGCQQCHSRAQSRRQRERAAA